MGIRAASSALAARPVRRQIPRAVTRPCGEKIKSALVCGSEQEGHQEMSQNPSLCYSRIFAWRRGEANEAFQALERHLDAPAGAVQFADPLGGEGFCIERGDKDDPSGGNERSVRDGVTFPLRCAPGLGPRLFSRLGRLLQSHKAKGQRRSFSASDPDGRIENTRAFRCFKSGRISQGLLSLLSQRAPFRGHAR